APARDLRVVDHTDVSLASAQSIHPTQRLDPGRRASVIMRAIAQLCVLLGTPAVHVLGSTCAAELGAERELDGWRRELDPDRSGPDDEGVVAHLATPVRAPTQHGACFAPGAAVNLACRHLDDVRQAIDWCQGIPVLLAAVAQLARPVSTGASHGAVFEQHARMQLT